MVYSEEHTNDKFIELSENKLHLNKQSVQRLNDEEQITCSFVCSQFIKLQSFFKKFQRVVRRQK